MINLHFLDRIREETAQAACNRTSQISDDEDAFSFTHSRPFRNDKKLSSFWDMNMTVENMLNLLGAYDVRTGAISRLAISFITNSFISPKINDVQMFNEFIMLAGRARSGDGFGPRRQPFGKFTSPFLVIRPTRAPEINLQTTWRFGRFNFHGDSPDPASLGDKWNEKENPKIWLVAMAYTI